MLFSNPVKGTIHPTSWRRPAGNRDFRLTQDFGPSGLGVEPTVKWPGGEGIPAGTYANFHRGIDLGDQRCGADVLAARGGRIDFAGIDGTGNRVVIISHGSGWRTWYGHLQDELVSVGLVVVAGKLIGHVGTSAATACHLHWAVEVNHGNGGDFEWVDPWRRLTQNITIHPKADDGINIRATAGSGTTPGPKFAATKAGRIIRADGTDLGPASQPRKWRATVTGASYTLDGHLGSAWERFDLGDGQRFVATPLAVVSQR